MDGGVYDGSYCDICCNPWMPVGKRTEEMRRLFRNILLLKARRRYTGGFNLSMRGFPLSSWGGIYALPHKELRACWLKIGDF